MAGIVGTIQEASRGAAQITSDALNAGNTHGTGRDEWDWSYKDRLVIPATAGQDSFFTVIAGKNLSATNLPLPSQIPSGESLTVHTVKPFYTAIKAHAAADVPVFFQFLAGTVCEISVSPNKILGQWTLQEMFGIPILFSVQEATIQFKFPQPLYNGLFPINQVIKLGGKTTFRVNVYYNFAPAALAGDYLDMSFAGMRGYST